MAPRWIPAWLPAKRVAGRLKVRCLVAAVPHFAGTVKQWRLSRIRSESIWLDA